MRTGNVVFVESLNIISLCSIFKVRRRTSRVILHETYACSNRTERAMDVYNKYKWFCDRFLSGVEFTVIPEMIGGKNYTWQANERVMEFLDRYGARLEGAFWGKFVSARLGSGKALVAVKGCMREELAQRILFLLQCGALEKEYGASLQTIFRTRIDNFSLFDFISPGIDREKFRHDGLAFYRVKEALKNIGVTISVFLHPIVELVRNGITLRMPEARTFDLAQHIANGFDVPEWRGMRGMNLSKPDDMLIREIKKTRPGVSFLFVFSGWPFPGNVKKAFRQYVDRLNGECASDREGNRIPLRMFLKSYLGNYSLPLALSIITRLFKPDTDTLLIKAIWKVTFSAVRYELFFSYYRPSVFIGRDDYNYTNSVRTIVMNRHGLRNVGISHSQCTFFRHLPGSCFVHMDAYLIRGEGYRRIFYPYWEDVRDLVTVGHPEADAICLAKGDTARHAEFLAGYGGRFTVLVPISRPTWRNFREEIVEEKYKDLPDILEIDPKIHIILRPRTMQAVDHFRAHFPKYEMYMKRGRITIETDRFTTYELLAYSDVVLGEDSSGVLFESLAADGAIPVTYGIRFDEYAMGMYNREMVVYNIRELKSAIARLFAATDRSSLQKDFLGLKKEFAPYGDGRSWERVSAYLCKSL